MEGRGKRNAGQDREDSFREERDLKETLTGQVKRGGARIHHRYTGELPYRKINGKIKGRFLGCRALPVLNVFTVFTDFAPRLRIFLRENGNAVFHPYAMGSYFSCPYNYERENFFLLSWGRKM